MNRRTHLPLAAILVLAIALCGCMKVGPDFLKPSAASPPDWLLAEYSQSRADLPVAGEWWRQLNDPALDRLVELSRAGNIGLHISAVRILQARAQLGISVGNLYPQSQQAVGAYAYTEASRRAPTAPQPEQQAGMQFQFWQNSVGFSAAWELDFWGKYRRGIESSGASLAASVADYDNALVSLASDVASTYILIRVSEDRLRIALENARLQREALNIADIRFRLGATSERDVMQARTLLESTLALLPQLNNALEKARNALSVLLGMPPSDLKELLAGTSAIPSCPEGVGVGIPADMLRRRPDVRAAEFNAAAQSARIGVAKAELFPSFSLTGNVGWLSSNVGAFSLADIATPQSFTATFGPSVSWNLFNYGRLVNNVRVQDALFQQGLLAYRNTVLFALKEVEDGLSDFQQSRLRTAELIKAAASARRGAELAFLQYREGKTDFTTVIVAQQDQLSQEDALAVSQGNIALGLVGLYRALGSGWENRPAEPVPADIKQEMKKRTWWGPMINESPSKQEDPAKAGPGRYVPDF